MADDQDKSQQTEEGSDKKIEDARNKGQVPSSKEPSTAITFTMISMVMITGIANWEGDRMQQLLTDYLSGTIKIEPTPLGIQQVLISVGSEMALMILPFAIPIMLLGVLVTVMVSGPVFTFETLIPKYSKIDPVAGIKRMFSTKSLAEFVKSVLKMVLISVVCTSVASAMYPDIMHAAFKQTSDIAKLAIEGSVKISTIVAVIWVALALTDVMYQRWEHAKSMRMSKKEQRDEHKDSEGDPQMKGKIRQMQMQQAQNRMMADVPDADVVITNPTHISIALAYDPLSPGAPKLLAKGKGHIAAKIRELARENHIPMRENKPLARSLFKQVNIGEEIPEVLFEAVAVILAEIFKMKNR
ncbi:MAG: flagellar biosynthesis protein FlhB [Mariprofundus sp.]|nr:flagellar biosynthesis protein FlhB [Mariprofundus sp.]